MADGTDPAIYDDLVRFKPEGLTLNGWAVKAGVNRTVWMDMRRHQNPARPTLVKLLAAADMTVAEFEALRIGTTPVELASGKSATEEGKRGWRGAPMAPIPLLSTSVDGEWTGQGGPVDLLVVDASTVVGKLSRPESLAGDADAYGMTMIDDSMWPRFRPGRQLLVSPRSPAAIGDDVAVRLRSSGVMIGELVRRSATAIELKQYRPDRTVRVPVGDVASIHKVVGEAY